MSKKPLAPQATPRNAILAMRINRHTDQEIAEFASKELKTEIFKSTIWRVRTGRSYPRRKLETALMKLAKKYGKQDG